MIEKLSSALSNPSLDSAIKTLRSKSNATVFINDLAVAPFLAAAVPPPFVFITPDAESVTAAHKIFTNCGLNSTAVSSVPDMPIYSETQASQNTALAAAVEKFVRSSADVLVLSAAALLSNVIKQKHSGETIGVGKSFSVGKLAEMLTEFGYTKTQTVAAAGEFSTRGDVVDFWQEGAAEPHRVMFFGDSIEAIKTFNAATFLSTATLANVEISPIAELVNISNDLVLSKISQNKKGLSPEILDTLQVRASRGERLAAVRWTLPFVSAFESVLDAVSSRTPALIVDRPREVMQTVQNTEKLNNTRFAGLLEGGLVSKQHAVMFTPSSEVLAKIPDFVCKGFQHINSSHNIFKTVSTAEVKTAPVANYFSNLSALVPDIVRSVDIFKNTVLVFVGGTKACENYMSAKHIPFVHSTLANIRAGEINLIRSELGCSFQLPDCGLVIYSIQPPPVVSAETNVFESTRESFVLPSVGEVVVHEHHGLGRFLGIKKLTLQDAERDYIVLQYDGGALVYIPPEQTQLLSNYQGEPARLSKIGGADFASAKQRVRRRLKELSFKLSELYAARTNIRANIYDADEQTLSQFAAAFPYSLTADQQKALDDINKDLSAAGSVRKVMDRLICGDVGYGKTEIAFRAVFRAIMSGYQVAMLCPTTILSVQHFNTARARFEPFGVKVEVLNRFKTDAEVQQILKELRSGNIDFIIGTHRLLSLERSNWRSLSMLVLDEEQRFGVGHKEKIKQLKTNVDVLTLSATPIPRTLNMALIGVRDISVIATPPQHRLPVITYTTEYSDALLSDAVIRETQRGGQTIILYNDVATINKFAAYMRTLLSGTSKTGLRIGVVHGQMNAVHLEETIAALYNRQIDVLVASTIIENGVDISTANTLVVIDADRLGLAQMHQLRGRVGRGTAQAFAYFTTAHNKQITELAGRRLVAISNNSGSGAGMQIAMKDLHLRGGGSILGANQSGHMEQIGFHTYCQILQQVSEENRNARSGGAETTAKETPEPEIETVLDIALNCFVPHTYIESEQERMKVYVAISQIQTQDDSAKIITHLEDLYGKPPAEVRNTVTVGYIRALAKPLGVKHISFNKNECRITFDKTVNQYEMLKIITAKTYGLVNCVQGINLAARLCVPSITNLITFLRNLSGN